MLTGAEGAVVTFEGMVRNNTNGRSTLCLDYEGYEPWRSSMSPIGAEMAAAFALAVMAMVHRLGRMLIGETSVVVIVTAPHRRAAFEAALEGIDRLKKPGSYLEEGAFRRWRAYGWKGSGTEMFRPSAKALCALLLGAALVVAQRAPSSATK